MLQLVNKHPAHLSSSATQTSRGSATKLVVAIASPAGSTTLCQTGRTQGIQVAFPQKHRRARVLYPAARDPCAEPCHGIWLGIGAPGEFVIWATAAQKHHGTFRPSLPHFNDVVPYTSRWLMDDGVVVEPVVGNPHRAIFGGYGRVGPRSNQLGKIG